jgi:hypothetical protein
MANTSRSRFRANRYSVGHKRIDTIFGSGAKNSLWSTPKNGWFAREPFTCEAERCVHRSPAGHRQYALTSTTPRDDTKV